ncbi:hypothetical protein HHK36_033140 [Tetracentron sinense]|uniref:Solute-binding protein family 3/N-terminal domain-containing protein n=1 Tax=Tetracentron sinense TaxID=13715 RepID=A0A835CX06_TETSI|nr:hypothetical protein HHK36_033140 [Tetracentron sinense]
MEVVRGSYDELVKEVKLQTYDAVVGDITIVANRSLYVDFTLPYLESGVSMVVLIKDDESKNAWIFLKPLSWDLWLTTGAAFIFTGVVGVVWQVSFWVGCEEDSRDKEKEKKREIKRQFIYPSVILKMKGKTEIRKGSYGAFKAQNEV